MHLVISLRGIVQNYVLTDQLPKVTIEGLKRLQLGSEIISVWHTSNKSSARLVSIRSAITNECFRARII